MTVTHSSPHAPTATLPTVSTWAGELALVVLGSAFLAVSAQVAVRLPLAISPVPITGQTFAVLLMAALYGPRRAVAAVALYIVEGAGGLPVFAAGAAGPVHLLGFTGGYLFGFLIAAWAVGTLARRGWDRHPATALGAMTIGTVLIFVPGLLWLAVLIGPAGVLQAGLIPFLPGAVVKIVLAAALLPLGRGIVGKLSPPQEAPR